MLTATRAIAIYRRTNGGPWEFGLVRLTGQDDAGTEDQAILIESPDWPEWLTRFVADNLPKDATATSQIHVCPPGGGTTTEGTTLTSAKNVRVQPTSKVARPLA